MKVLAIAALILGSALAHPAKLDHLQQRSGYNYDPPAEPSGLYDLPTTKPTTTTTTTTPPPPPISGYLPPEADQSSGHEVFVSVLPDPEPAKPMMLMPYNFAYGVEDGDDGPNFRHEEISDGANVHGEYSVMLPDGRMQVVKFKSAPDTGYVAEVSYI